MKAKVIKPVCWLLLPAFLASCVGANDSDADIIGAVHSLRGQSREKAQAALGPPYYTMIGQGVTTSYWQMSEVEDYLGVSNKRIISQTNGKPEVYETMGVLMKQHRHKCLVVIKSDETSTIIDSNVSGSARGCSSVLGKVKTASRL